MQRIYPVFLYIVRYTVDSQTTQTFKNRCFWDLELFQDLELGNGITHQDIKENSDKIKRDQVYIFQQFERADLDIKAKL